MQFSGLTNEQQADIDIINNRNIINLWGLRGFIKHNPEKHDQSNWVKTTLEELSDDHDDKFFDCGTTACVAGWMVLLNGDKLLKTYASFDTLNFKGRRLYKLNYTRTKEGVEVPIGPRARDLLGLTSFVAAALFHPFNKRKALLKALKMLSLGKTDQEVFDYLKGLNFGIDSSFSRIEFSS